MTSISSKVAVAAPELAGLARQPAAGPEGPGAVTGAGCRGLWRLGVPRRGGGARRPGGGGGVAGQHWAAAGQSGACTASTIFDEPLRVCRHTEHPPPPPAGVSHQLSG